MRPHEKDMQVFSRFGVDPTRRAVVLSRSGKKLDLSGMFTGAAFLVCAGPSLVRHDLTLLSRRGIVTMAVNNAWSLVRPTFWVHVDSPGRFLDTCWRDPGILKFSPACSLDEHLNTLENGTPRRLPERTRDMPNVAYYARSGHFDHASFLTEPLFSWGNDAKTDDSLGLTGKRSVMLVAVKLLYWLGFRTVYLLGCDFNMTPENKYAFPEQRTAQAVNNNNATYQALNQRFTALRPLLDAEGFTVLNCNPDSGLTAFDFADYDDAIRAESKSCCEARSTVGWYVPPKQVKGIQ